MDNFHDYDYQLLRQNNARLHHFETSLDAASNLLELSEALHANTSLKSIRVHIHTSFAGMSPSEVLVFFEALGSRPNLERLFFGPMRRPKQAQIPTQALSLALIQASKLQLLQLWGLELYGNACDFITLGASLQRHPSLQEVKICNCRLAPPDDHDDDDNGDDDDKEKENTSSSLQAEHAYTLDPLVKALATIQPLQKVTFNAAIQNELGALSPECLGLLCRAPSLQAIDLQGFALDHAHIVAMLPGLCTNTGSGSKSSNSNSMSLKEICLGTVQLDETGDKNFARIIQTNTTLEYVDLKLKSGSSPVHIAQALTVNSKNHGSLRHLFIHGDITSTSQQAFAAAMEFNFVLESMELMNGSAHLPAIRFFLQMNALGRRELLEQHAKRRGNETVGSSASKGKWVEALINHRKDVSALFYLLSFNPLLCASSRG